MNNELLEKIKDILAETLSFKNTDNIHIHSKLKEDLGLDSMSSLTFLMALEDNIAGFKVNPDKLTTEHLASVQSITNYVNENIS